MARLLRWGLAASILWVADAFLRQTAPPRRTTLARPLNARLAGGQDPPFTFGGDGGAGGADRQAATQTQPALPNSAAQPDAKSLPFRLEKFMDGRQVLPQVGAIPYMSGNNYIDILSSMSPNDLIKSFTAAAPPRVQEAVKKTALRCIGSIHDYLVEDMQKTTGVMFANLLYKSQITGYLLYNAEQQVQKMVSLAPPKAAQARPNLLPPATNESPIELSGTIKVFTEEGAEVEVNAQEYIRALTAEAEALRAELERLEQEKREILSRDLLSLISEMSTRQSAELTAGMTEDVVEAMKMLVSRVLVSIQERPISGEDPVELPSSALAQLIMWGLVTGFQLRELEKSWGDYGRPASPSLLTPPLQPPAKRPPPPPPRNKGRGRGRRPRGPGGRGGGGEEGPYGGP